YETFKAPVAWVPQSPRIRGILKQEDPGIDMVSWDNPGLIDVREWQRSNSGWVNGENQIVVGRYSRDDEIKYPASYKDLTTAYGFGPNYRVRFMGGISQVRRLLRAEGLDGDALPANWSLLAHKAMDVHEFLDGIDFFVYYDNPGRHEAFGRVLLEAAASGVVTIADPRHRDTFGDAIDYAPAHEVQELVASYVADPKRYSRRSTEARRIVAERFGYESFIAKIRPLLKSAHATDPVAAVPSEAGTFTFSISDRGPLSAFGIDVSPSVRASQIPVRTLADASLMDELVLVTGEQTQELNIWAQSLLSGFERLVLDPQRFASAPQEVVSIAYRLGRSVRVLTRPEHTLLASAGLEPANDGGVTAWSSWNLTHPNASLTVQT
uniref:glycosyltransferase n=1 Tax=Pseudactinotalea sp. TaxID=1926260 RepID=UPI003B3B50F0